MRKLGFTEVTWCTRTCLAPGMNIWTMNFSSQEKLWLDCVRFWPSCVSQHRKHMHYSTGHFHGRTDGNLDDNRIAVTSHRTLLCLQRILSLSIMFCGVISSHYSLGAVLIPRRTVQQSKLVCDNFFLRQFVQMIYEKQFVTRDYIGPNEKWQ